MAAGASAVAASSDASQMTSQMPPSLREPQVEARNAGYYVSSKDRFPRITRSEMESRTRQIHKSLTTAPLMRAACLRHTSLSSEELCIDTARGGEGGRHESNALVIRIVRLVLRNFFPGRIPEGLVKVGRAAQLAHLVRVVRIAPALVREGEVEDEVAMHCGPLLFSTTPVIFQG